MKTLLLFLISGLIGFIMVSYIIYIRLILIRLPREVFMDVGDFRLAIYFELFILFFIISFLLARELYREWYNVEAKKESFIFSFIKIRLMKISAYINVCLAICDLMLREIFLALFKIESQFIVFFLINQFNLKCSPRAFLIIFLVIPRVLIVMCLLIDVFFTELFHYFYLCGPLYIMILLHGWFKYSIEYEWFQRWEPYWRIKKDNTTKEKTMSPLEFNNYLMLRNYVEPPYVFTMWFTENYYKIHPEMKTDEDVDNALSSVYIYLRKCMQGLNLLGELKKIENKVTYNIFRLGISIIFSMIWGYVFIGCLFIRFV